MECKHRTPIIRERIAATKDSVKAKLASDRTGLLGLLVKDLYAAHKDTRRAARVENRQLGLIMR